MLNIHTKTCGVLQNKHKTQPSMGNKNKKTFKEKFPLTKNQQKYRKERVQIMKISTSYHSQKPPFSPIHSLNSSPSPTEQHPQLSLQFHHPPSLSPPPSSL